MKAEAWSSLILESSKGSTLPALLAALLDLSTMRRIATEKGIGAKGFRVEKAPMQRLAELLGKEATKNKGLREELAETLCRVRLEASPKGSGEGAAKGDKPSPAKKTVDPAGLKAMELRLRKAEKKSQRAAESAAKARASREKSLEELASQKQIEADLRREIVRLTKDCDKWKRSVEQNQSQVTGAEARQLEAAQRELRRLQERIGDLEEQDRTHRLSEAEDMSRIRELETQVQELDALLPRGKKERVKRYQKNKYEKRATPNLIPVYSRDFLDALERISESDQHRIHTTLAQVVLWGLEQPGLRVKSLKGKGELLSLRAGIHHRIYFTRTGDKLMLHHVGTREEQDTFLKRLRD